MDDRERVAGLVGGKVAVRLNSVEARGVEIVATLEEARDDGIVLSEVGELGPGPTMFCPWDSLARVRERPPWLAPPHEEPEETLDERGFYELREAAPEEVVPEPPVERPRASARNLERVVPVAQKQAVGGITVTFASLELFGEGVGVLRYLISSEEGLFEYGIPEPELVLRDASGRVLPWSPRGSGSRGGEADGEVEVRDLPQTGVLEVEVTRLASLGFDEEVGEEVEEDSYDGPWTFEITI